MKKKIRILSLVIVLAGVLCLYTMRVVQLNTKWPAPELEVYQLGDTVEGPYGTEYTVHSARFMSQEEGEQYYVERNRDWQQIYLVVDVSFTNTTDRELQESFGFLSPRSGAWSNGNNPYFYTAMNESGGKYSEFVAPGETIRRTLVYNLVDVQFRDYQWPHVTERPVELIINSYPVLRVVELFPENAA